MNRIINSLSDLVTGTAATGHVPLYHTSGGWKTVRGGTYDVRAYGALGDGTTDDSVAIQAAIDACATGGGGVVSCPPAIYRCNVTLKSGVYLVGSPIGYGYTPGVTPIRQTEFLAAGSGVVIDTPVAASSTLGVCGINVVGLGAGTAVKGIRFRDVNWGMIKNVMFFNLADESILIDSGSLACTIEDVLAIGSILNRSRAAVIGTVDVAGTDHFLSRIESSISGDTEGTVQSVNLYCAAVVMRGDACTLESVIGEISDVGFHVTGKYNRFTNCRADLNYGHGFRLVGAQFNSFATCLALNNSQDTTNTYDGFVAESDTLLNTYASCLAVSSAAKVHRYGFTDAVATFQHANVYTNCHSYQHGTTWMSLASTHSSSVAVTGGTYRTLTADSTTPSVADYVTFVTGNTVATTITTFVDGVPGQEIMVLCADDNTTIQHGFPSGISLNLGNGGTRKLRNGCWYRFVCLSSVNWRLVEPNNSIVSADNGDAAKTLSTRTSEDIQVWATPLTADRGVTLSTTGAFNGATFHIVRTAAATGAFNLNVGTGPLKALAAGQWCDVVYNGSAWVLTSFGSL